MTPISTSLQSLVKWIRTNVSHDSTSHYDYNQNKSQHNPVLIVSLRWRHNERDSVLNHQPHDCLLNGLFRRRSKKISKLRVTGLCVGNSPGPVNSPHKGPVTRKMFPFDGVIMLWIVWQHTPLLTDEMPYIKQKQQIRHQKCMGESIICCWQLCIIIMGSTETVPM